MMRGFFSVILVTWLVVEPTVMAAGSPSLPLKVPSQRLSFVEAAIPPGLLSPVSQKLSDAHHSFGRLLKSSGLYGVQRGRDWVSWPTVFKLVLRGNITPFTWEWAPPIMGGSGKTDEGEIPWLDEESDEVERDDDVLAPYNFSAIPMAARPLLVQLEGWEQLFAFDRPGVITYPKRIEALLSDIVELGEALEQARQQVRTETREAALAAIQRTLITNPGVTQKALMERCGLRREFPATLRFYAPFRANLRKLANGLGHGDTAGIIPSRPNDLSKDHERNLRAARDRARNLFHRLLRLALESYSLSGHQLSRAITGKNTPITALYRSDGGLLSLPRMRQCIKALTLLLAQSERPCRPLYLSVAQQIAYQARWALVTELGRSIRRLRLQRSVGSKELSRLTGVSKPTANHVEHARNGPGGEVLVRMLEALGLPPEAIHTTDTIQLDHRWREAERNYIARQSAAAARLNAFVKQRGLVRTWAELGRSNSFVVDRYPEAKDGWTVCDPQTLSLFAELTAHPRETMRRFWNEGQVPDLIDVRFAGAQEQKPNGFRDVRTDDASALPPIDDIPLDSFPAEAVPFVAALRALQANWRFEEPGLRLRRPPHIDLSNLVDILKGIHDAQASLHKQMVLSFAQNLSRNLSELQGRTTEDVFRKAGEKRNHWLGRAAGRYLPTRATQSRLAKSLGVRMEDLIPERPENTAEDQEINLDRLYRDGISLLLVLMGIAILAAEIPYTEAVRAAGFSRSFPVRPEEWYPAFQARAVEAIAHLSVNRPLLPVYLSVTEVMQRWRPAETGSEKEVEARAHLYAREVAAGRILNAARIRVNIGFEKLRRRLKMVTPTILRLEKPSGDLPHGLWFEEQRMRRVLEFFGLRSHDVWDPDDLIEIHWITDPSLPPSPGERSSLSAA